MADEFVKGLGIATVGGLLWMVLSGWYTTPGFAEAQLWGAIPDKLDAYGQAAMMAREALAWFIIFGILAFWVVIPALNRYREASS